MSRLIRTSPAVAGSLRVHITLRVPSGLNQLPMRSPGASLVADATGFVGSIEVKAGFAPGVQMAP